MLTLSNNPIRVDDGLYCLNDLHKASGGDIKHKPAFFLRNEQTKDVVSELQNSNSIENIMRVKRGGTNQGTWVCKELVYSYAMWISAKFHIAVIRTFDAAANQYQKLDKQLDGLYTDLNNVTISLSQAGRFLNNAGKKIKPQIQKSIDNILKEMQLSLNLVGGADHE